MNAPRYKTQARQGLVYDADPPLAAPPAAAPAPVHPAEQRLSIDDLGMQTQPHVVVWRPIETAERDGRPLMVKPSIDAPGPGTPAVWHRTRQWRDGKWHAIGFWGDPVNKWRLRFEPLFWRSPVYGQGVQR